MSLLNVPRPRDSLLSQSPSAILALLRPSIRNQAIKIEGLSSARSDPFDFFGKDRVQPEEKDNETTKKTTFILRTPKKGILVKKNKRTSSLLLNEDKTPDGSTKGSSCPSFKVMAEVKSENLDSLEQTPVHKTNLMTSSVVPRNKKVSFAPDVQSREGGQRPRIKKLTRKVRNQNVNDVEDINLNEKPKCEENVSENLSFRLALNGVVSPTKRQSVNLQAENVRQPLLKVNHDSEVKELETNLRHSFEQRNRKLSDQELLNIKLPSIVSSRQTNTTKDENLLGSNRSAKSLREFMSPRAFETSSEKNCGKESMFNAGLVWKKDDDLAAVMKARLHLIHQYDSPITSTPDLYVQEERTRQKRSLFRAHNEHEGLLMAL